MSTLSIAPPITVTDEPGLAIRTARMQASSGIVKRLLTAIHPAGVLVILAGLAWAALFGNLAVLRHIGGGTNAQDLGFTDQVLWNSLHGDWFRMSLYLGAADWNTEMAVAAVAQPDSLLAFHFEPMLALLLPIYALGGDARHLLVLQALVFALGAIPAYRLAARWSGSQWAGAATGATYLLSPLGQSAMLSDFHTTALAAPVLLLAIERAAAQRTLQALGAALLAVTAREDAAVAVGAVGLFVLLTGARRTGAALVVIGGIGSVLSFGVIGWYGGGAWAFAPRYAGLQEGLHAVADALARPEVLEFAGALLLSGGLLGMLAPLLVLPLVPLAGLNALSASPWMATGRAHYSVLVLPLAIAAAAFALGRLAELRAPRPQRAVRGAALALFAGAIGAHLWAGLGPLGANFAPSAPNEHSAQAELIATRIPTEASVTASSNLVPRVSRRQSVYLFPAVGTADYVFVDVAANAAPTSPGDVFLRLQELLAAGGWHVQAADDGLLLLARRPGAPPIRPSDLPFRFFSFARRAPEPATPAEGFSGLLMPAAALSQPLHGGRAFSDTNLELLGAELVTATDDTVAVDGVRGVLRTSWRATGPVPSGAWLEITTSLVGSREYRASDLAANWWYPPGRWSPGEVVHLDVVVPLRGLTGWSARVRVPEE